MNSRDRLALRLSEGYVERKSMDDPRVQSCTEGGVGHDLRLIRTVNDNGMDPRETLACVWCGGVVCGSGGCREIYHHRGDHRDATGVTWPLGGNRPKPGKDWR